MLKHLLARRLADRLRVLLEPFDSDAADAVAHAAAMEGVLVRASIRLPRVCHGETPARPRRRPGTMARARCRSPGQPRAAARCRSAYWRAVDSVVVRTRLRVDWRTCRPVSGLAG